MAKAQNKKNKLKAKKAKQSKKSKRGFFNKKTKDEDISIISDQKEPFSWNVFWDEQVIGRWKKLRWFLEEKGILFFLTSIVQYRNRLITKLIIVCLGIGIGLGPRSVSLIKKSNAMNAQSELSRIIDGQFKSGNILIKPLMSSNYKKVHMLAFNIIGDTTSGVPSTTDKYEISLKPFSGVVDAESISYRYSILPIDSSRRILLVYIDTTKQDDSSGVFTLDIHAKGDKRISEQPLTIVLSDKQKTTKLLNNDGLNLSPISAKLIDKSTAIADAQKSIKKSLETYKLNEDRLIASGYSLKPTTSDLIDSLPDYLSMPEITDTSDISVIDDLDLSNKEIPDFGSELTIDGKVFSAETIAEVQRAANSNSNKVVPVIANGNTNENADENTDDKSQQTVTNGISDIDTPIINDVSETDKILKDIFANVQSLNTARRTRYNQLILLSQALNKSIDLSDFTKSKHLK